jgi:hypothetical protein
MYCSETKKTKSLLTFRQNKKQLLCTAHGLLRTKIETVVCGHISEYTTLYTNLSAINFSIHSSLPCERINTIIPKAQNVVTVRHTTVHVTKRNI